MKQESLTGSPAKWETSIEPTNRIEDGSRAFQLRLNVGNMSFTICAPRDDSLDAASLRRTFEDALRYIAAAPLGPPVAEMREGEPAPREVQLGREALGRIVRQAWMAWAREQPTPKASWLQTWEELTEPEREVDRRIGETLLAHFRIVNVAFASCEHSVEAPSTRTVPLQLLVAAKLALRDVNGSYAREVWCDLKDAIAGVAPTRGGEHG
jgi:hypothetical protein